MSLKLEGKIAVVTGASKGIGAGIAKGLAKAGASVVVNYSGSKEDADKVVEQITADGGNAVAVQGSVAKKAEVEQLFNMVKETYGRVDILVNNAGVFKFEPVEAVTEEEFNFEYGINVLGTIYTTQEALKHFPETGGNIVNISSVASTNPTPYSSLYSSTKGAVDTLSKALAKELAPRNIRVNVVAPGATDTEGARRLGFIDSDAIKGVIAATPLGRIGQPKDIADVVTFLASDDAAWLTGERIAASGGF
jgi:3-oxoacyl-[acyl-carrier protein] reductase